MDPIWVTNQLLRASPSKKACSILFTRMNMRWEEHCSETSLPSHCQFLLPCHRRSSFIKTRINFVLDGTPSLTNTLIVPWIPIPILTRQELAVVRHPTRVQCGNSPQNFQDGEIRHLKVLPSITTCGETSQE